MRRTSLPFAHRLIGPADQREATIRGADLSREDLRERGELLHQLAFDSETRWPSRDRLPEGFDPQAVLEAGKDPGLGLRALHREGIDGRGVGVAFIDQPLCGPHIEYPSFEYRHTEGLADSPNSMHGPAVLSLLAGKSCGVAPGVRPSYWGTPGLIQPGRSRDRAPLEAILKSNAEGITPRIRVVGISWAGFHKEGEYEEYLKLAAKAEREGVLLITCESDKPGYVPVVRRFPSDPNDPRSYKRHFRFCSRLIGVPCGGRTSAAMDGPESFVYWPFGGLSWGAPYLAGLVAVALQVNPELTPAELRQLFIWTATDNGEARVVSPRGIVEAAKRG